MGSLKPAGAASSEDAGFLATRIDELVNWGRKNSLWPMPLGLSCCGIELMAMIGPKFDIARFGAEAARFSPRQCDLLIVAGTSARVYPAAGLIEVAASSGARVIEVNREGIRPYHVGDAGALVTGPFALAIRTV